MNVYDDNGLVLYVDDSTAGIKIYYLDAKEYEMSADSTGLRAYSTRANN